MFCVSIMAKLMGPIRDQTMLSSRHGQCFDARISSAMMGAHFFQ
jgi:hypothetical protein